MGLQGQILYLLSFLQLVNRAVVDIIDIDGVHCLDGLPLLEQPLFLWLFLDGKGAIFPILDIVLQVRHVVLYQECLIILDFDIEFCVILWNLYCVVLGMVAHFGLLLLFDDVS